MAIFSDQTPAKLRATITSLESTIEEYRSMTDEQCRRMHAYQPPEFYRESAIVTCENSIARIRKELERYCH